MNDFLSEIYEAVPIYTASSKKNKYQKSVPDPIDKPNRKAVTPAVDDKTPLVTAACFFPGSADQDSKPTLQNVKLRVACYIRVSSTSPAQEDSYEAQEKYFSKLLSSHEDWTGVGVYSDYGRSGTQRDSRTGFNRLMRHCEQHRIDRIIVKSISRFSRNVADLVEAIRRLKELNITVYFEKESIDTGDMKSEFVLTALAAIAQEESRTISSNIRWGNEKRFPKGEVPNIAIYGYRYDGDSYETTDTGYKLRKLIIVDEEAKVVQRIFNLFLEGKGQLEIARILNIEHIPAPKVTPIHFTKRRTVKEGIEQGWTRTRISYILKNERYCGDVLIQKTFTADYLTHKQKVNNGEISQYYIKNHHPAIISRKTYEDTQKWLEKDERRRTSVSYPLSGRLICSQCGRSYTTRASGYHRAWLCGSTVEWNGLNICHSEKVYEKQVHVALRKAVAERFQEMDKLRSLLESVQEFDYVETDRIILKKQILALEYEISDAQEKKARAEGEAEVLLMRKEMLREEIDEKALNLLTKKAKDAEKRAADKAAEKSVLESQLEQKESFWEQMENDYLIREKAISWMKGKDRVTFLNGLHDYLQAFVLSITVHNPRRFTFRWFDNSETLVEIADCTTDYHHTRDYWDGEKWARGIERR